MATILEAPGPALPTESMSKHYYLDADVYEQEKARIFHRHWQCVGHLSELEAPGSFFTADVAGQGIVVVKDAQQAVRAFYNVCQHRAHTIVSDRGVCDRFVCPYHGWTYGLDGALIGARGTAGVAGFEQRRIRLQPVKVDTSCGLVFVNLDDTAAPLKSLLGRVEAEIAEASPGFSEMRLAAEHTWRHNANWKVSVENFSECYHCPVVHRYLVANTYSADDYRISFDGPIIRHSTTGHRDPKVHGGELLIWFVWPNLAVELYPLHRAVSLRFFWPRSPSETDYVYRWYVDSQLAPEHVQAVVDYAQVHHDTTGKEDADITAQVQIGLQSRGYNSGPLVVTAEISNESENAVAHWQSLYLQQMSGSD